MEAKKKQITQVHQFRKSAAISLILLITFVSFAPCLSHGFLGNWDDMNHLTANTAVRAIHPSNVREMFTTTVNQTYIPLTLSSFAVEHHFFGYNPFIYHLNNLLLHMAVVVLVFLFFLKIGVGLRAAFFAALLFGIHPMRVESVAWITERKDVLYSLFYMSALCSYWKYLENRQKIPYYLTVLFGFLSILSKPMALSLPLILFVCDWMYGRKWDVSVFTDKIIHFLYIVPIAWKTYSLFLRVPFNHIDEAVLIWTWSFIFYMRKFIFPVNLLPHYELPQPVLFAHQSYMASIGLLILLAYLIYFFRRNRWFIFAVAFYFFSIFFLLRFDKANDINIVADRFMYLPSVGFCILFGILINRILKVDFTKRIALKWGIYFCVVILFTTLSIKTYRQTKIWRNETDLWTYVIQKRPQNPLAYINRAMEYKNRRQYDLAIADCSKAIDINPRYYISARTNENNEYSVDNEDLIEIDKTNLALANNPHLYGAHYLRGSIYQITKQYELAIFDFNKVLGINPNHAEAYFYRSLSYRALGDEKKSLEDALKARMLGYEEKGVRAN